MKPLLAVTMGDPNGVGPELLLKAARSPRYGKKYRALVFGDLIYLRVVSRRLGKKSPVILGIDYSGMNQSFRSVVNPRGHLFVVDFKNISQRPTFGRSTIWGGRASGEYIAAAVQSAQHHMVDGVVTLPINKVSFNRAGWGKRFVGHTEMLAALCRSQKVALMLVHENLRAVHVTQHISLAKVASAITQARVLETIQLTDRGLKEMGIKKQRIVVCGLNPHAGDEGLLGKEEKNKIAPAVRTARARGIDVVGPLSADAVWPKVQQGDFDAGVAMYHDQGQIAVKLAGLGAGVNVTLGLPIVRTSVMHGTAYDIAGKGQASTESLLDALDLAAEMTAQRRNK